MSKVDIDKILLDWSFRCQKGYPDMDNPSDVLALKQVLKENNIELPLYEEEATNPVVKLMNSSGLFDDYGAITASGKDTLKLRFSDIPSRGDTSDSMRREVYDLIKGLVDKSDSLSNFKKLATGSSLGSVTVEYDGKTYKLIVKGSEDNTKSDTDVKEALVSLFYISDIDTPFTKENYSERIPKLIAQAEKGIPGETTKASTKVVTYLKATENTVKAATVNFINQPLSSALAIKEAYPGQKLIRSGVFDEIRTVARHLTGLPADKWCPGDLYVQLGDVTGFENADNIEIINDLFNDEWGGDDKPLTAVSLKQADAQGGKAKALLNKYVSVKSEFPFNLSKDEINYTAEEMVDEISNLRRQMAARIEANPNMVYNLQAGDLYKGDPENDANIRSLRGKMAALKSIEFLFQQFPDDEVDEAVVALVGFALSLTGVNPTFYKVTGKKSGEPGAVSEFKRGQNIVLYNVDGDYEPIIISDTPTFGGLKLDFKILKGGKPYSVSVNARNNGNTQGTIEVQKIKPLS